MKFLLMLVVAVAVTLASVSAEMEIKVTERRNVGGASEAIVSSDVASKHLIGMRGGSFCKTCVSLGSSGINTLLNYILNAGVVGGCGKLCSKLPKGIEQTGCSIVCDIVGVQAFAKAIEKVDLDPIYLCEEIKLCPAGPDDADGSVDGVSVTPASGSVTQGVTFVMELDFTVTNETGVGEVVLDVKGPGATRVGQGFVNTGYSPGHYSAKVNLQPKDDPSANPPVEWLPGTYNYTFSFCQGECGSKHPHSKDFGTKMGSFQITV